MLYPVNYYYHKLRESSRYTDLNSPIEIFDVDDKKGINPYWSDVKNLYQYVDKCYGIAQQVQFEELRREFRKLTVTNDKNALLLFNIKISELSIGLSKQDISIGIGYTPISHILEQLNNLEYESYSYLEFLWNSNVAGKVQSVEPHKKEVD